jgi:hypothetical protein
MWESFALKQGVREERAARQARCPVGAAAGSCQGASGRATRRNAPPGQFAWAARANDDAGASGFDGLAGKGVGPGHQGWQRYTGCYVVA